MIDNEFILYFVAKIHKNYDMTKYLEEKVIYDVRFVIYHCPLSPFYLLLSPFISLLLLLFFNTKNSILALNCTKNVLKHSVFWHNTLALLTDIIS